MHPSVAPRPDLRVDTALRFHPAMRDALEILRLSSPDLRRLVENRSSRNPFLRPAEFSEEEEGRRRHFEESAFRETFDDVAAQLDFLGLSEEDRAAADAVAGHLNADGYLAVPLADAAASCGASPETAERALKIVQSLDPPGLGARDLRECLMIQAERGLDSAEPALRDAVRAILRGHFSDLARRRYARIAAALGISEELCRRAAERIRRFNPRPGPGRSAGAVPLRIPDMRFVRGKNGWRILYERAPVDLAVPAGAWLKNPALSEEEKKALRLRLQEAVSLVRALEIRQKTLTRLARFVIERQAAFLERGETELRPLRLRDAADEIGAHPSTVSRALAHKYVDTPRGVLALRAFFSRPVAEGRRAVTSLSRESIRRRIALWVGREDESRPLTDARICARLKKEGCPVSRRTVAQYRAQAGILPAHYRKSG